MCEVVVFSPWKVCFRGNWNRVSWLPLEVAVTTIIIDYFWAHLLQLISFAQFRGVALFLWFLPHSLCFVNPCALDLPILCLLSFVSFDISISV